MKGKPAKKIKATAPAAFDSKDVKILGTKESPVTKIFDITDCKVTQENGVVVVRGYGNTKGNKDRYGDIPTVYEGVRNYVYEIGEFLKNPVMLLDHSNQVSHIAGSFPEIEEDAVGLRIKAVFSNSDLPEIKHARTVFLEGHARAFSIAGIWHFEDKENPNNLTYAEIFHISPVGVGADPNALGDASLEAPDPGKGAAAEGDKAPPWKYCICTGKDCSYWTPKKAAEACKMIKCPECGSELTGSNEKPKKYVEPETAVVETDPADGKALKEATDAAELKRVLTELSTAVGGDEGKKKLQQKIQELKKILENKNS